MSDKKTVKTNLTTIPLNEINEETIITPSIKIEQTLETSFLGKNEKLAIRGRNICLTYGSGNKTNFVLNNLSINVIRGHIYGLLGPSGCGKTSLLKIICGLLKPEYGSLHIFGYLPGTCESGVPGAGIGYMPQDISLQSDLTVREMLIYFGKLYLIPKERLEKEIDFLVNLLQIPDKNRLIAHLSGGQKRRCSLACTIIHKPRLAILDEPTVGVDPILCSRIWQFLNDLRDNHNMTIVITTHYIEECRKANTIGFMRKGEILDEDNPDKIINRFNASTLEEVFYKICMSQKMKTINTNINDYINNNNNNNFIDKFKLIDNESHLDACEPFQSEHEHSSLYLFCYSIYILSWRYILQSIRKRYFLGLLFFFPTFALFCLCLAVGGKPKHLPVGWIVNEKINELYHILPEHASFNNYNYNYDDINDNGIDRKYLNDHYHYSRNNTLDKILHYPSFLKSYIDKETLDLIDYSFIDDAYEDARNLKLKGFIEFSKNFSISFQSRLNMRYLEDISDQTIRAGTIHIYTDESDVFATVTIQLIIEEAFFKLLNEKASIIFGLSQKNFKLPISLEDPIYGANLQEQYLGAKNFLAPGYLLLLTYSISLALSSLAFLLEHNDKMYDRNSSTGISLLALILSQLIARFVFLSISTLIVFFFSIYIFSIPCYGSHMLAIALFFLQILVSQINGMVLALLIPSLFSLTFVATGAVLFIFFVSGIFWPLESLPYYIRWFSNAMPFTIPGNSIRNIMIRKNAPFHPMIWPGFAISGIWFVIFLILCLTLFRKIK